MARATAAFLLAVVVLAAAISVSDAARPHHVHSTKNTPAQYHASADQHHAHQQRHAQRGNLRGNRNMLEEDCNGGTIIPTVFFLPAQDDVITNVCNENLGHNCESPDYVLSGTNYWSIGSSAENTDKVIACAEEP